MEKLGSSLKLERESKAAEFHGAFSQNKGESESWCYDFNNNVTRQYFKKQGIFWSLGRNGVCCLVRTTAS